ncbi:MAG: CPBP family intramembrane metalloprotease [Acidipila sp.]|nr:CPBP family intramembrane metalloprotease [Acidipila sp.]
MNILNDGVHGPKTDFSAPLSAPPPPPPVEKLRALLHSIAFSAVAILFVYLIFGMVLNLKGPFDHRLLPIMAYGLAITALLLESWLFLTLGDEKEFNSLGLTFHPGWGTELLAGAGTGFALMAGVCGMLAATHLARYSGLARYPHRVAAPLFATAAFILLAAALEEVAFRGYAFQRLIDATGAFGAVAIFSLLFGLVHYTNPSATVLSTANTVLAGIVMALGYLRTRALWFPIGLHFAWNFFLGPIASFPVSGIHLGFTMFEVHVQGPLWLTGGDYGPEGSIILTAACLLAVAWLARKSELLLPAARETPYDRDSGS